MTTEKRGHTAPYGTARDLLERWLDCYGGSTCADGDEQADMDKLDFDTRAWLSFGPYPVEAPPSEIAPKFGDAPRVDALNDQQVLDWNAKEYPDLHDMIEQHATMRTLARTLERELTEAKAETKRVIEIGKKFERDSHSFFEQSCINLQRAEAAESRLSAAVLAEREALETWNRQEIEGVEVSVRERPQHRSHLEYKAAIHENAIAFIRARTGVPNES